MKPLSTTWRRSSSRSMHERKMRMFEDADAFVVLPGAIGTLEEAVELLSWRRLGLHAKPIVFYDPDGFWGPSSTSSSSSSQRAWCLPNSRHAGRRWTHRPKRPAGPARHAGRLAGTPSR